MSKNPLYFITLMPSPDIQKEVKKIKKEIRLKYGLKHALKLPAHITLQIPFRMPENKETALSNKLENFCKKYNSWETELENFGKFDKRVLFIKVLNHKPFIKLHSDLQDLMLSFIDLQSHEMSSKIHPHITIATRDLKRSHFPEIWEDFKDRNYSTSFMCEKIFLLKHNDKSWDFIKSFGLNGEINSAL